MQLVQRCVILQHKSMKIKKKIIIFILKEDGGLNSIFGNSVLV